MAHNRNEVDSPEFVTIFAQCRGQEYESDFNVYQDTTLMLTDSWPEQEFSNNYGSPTYLADTHRPWDDPQENRQGRSHHGGMDNELPDEGGSRQSGRQHRGRQGGPGGTLVQWEGNEEEERNRLEQLVTILSSSPTLHQHPDAASTHQEPNVGNWEGSGSWDSQWPPVSWALDYSFV